VAGALSPLAPAADAGQLMVAASSLTLMVGGVLLIAFILRLGFLADFNSAPVLTGFKGGVQNREEQGWRGRGRDR
jgi:MFS superfamily sulfate permease-like transporter